MGVGDVIRRMREERGWTQQQLSSHSGLSRSYISLLEIGEIDKPSGKVLTRLAHAFRMSMEEMMRAMGYLPGTSAGPRRRGIDEILEEARAAAPMAVPLIEEPAGAGPGQMVIDYVYLSPTVGRGRNMFAISVKGSSMAPRIEEGDIVVVDRDARPQDGQTVVAMTGDRVLLNRFVRKEHRIELHSEQGEKTVASEDQVLGVVVQIIKKA